MNAIAANTGIGGAGARRTPPDDAARAAIRDDRQATLFVEAGAGAGKTTSLVARIVGLVADGTGIESIAAITFTEKAAAELRHKTRAKLTEVAADAPAGSAERGRFENALDRLDHAPIGTLHGFARRILNEFPIEAGLPPGFSVLDELESNIGYDDRWEELIDRLLADAAPAGGAGDGGSALYEICTFDKFGLLPKLATVPTGFQNVAAGFQANWDLVEARVELTPPPEWQPDFGLVLELADAVARAVCPDDDAQVGWCEQICVAAATVRAAPTLGARLRGLADLTAVAGKAAGKGAQGKWGKRVDELFALRDLHQRLADAGTVVLTEAREHRRLLVGSILGRWVLEAADARRAEGTLEFHDLLVLARRLLATDPLARAQLHARYTRLLLDEFQDTDPIQLEIAVRLTADPQHPAQAPGGDWRALQPMPGRLFVVGDPKQSIYRFRRADIKQYLGTAAQIGADELQLTANFRSSEAVIGWVNDVFSRAIIAEPDVQPEYRALAVAREGRVDHGRVCLLGAEERPGLTAEQRRDAEATDVAAIITRAIAEAWPVGDADAPGGMRPARPGDVCILLPARTSLDALERALRSAGIPYRAENSSVVYVTTEIRHLMLALRAADDRTDEFALVAALRTPLYGCSDVDLYEWKLAGGRFQMWSPVPDGQVHSPVAESIAHLESLSRRSSRSTPADLLAALVDERRLLDAALDAADSRDVWRRVRFVVEQARAWSDAGGHGLRRYLRWVQLQATESRSADTVLPETDHDAVRIMTVHAAKGLEFPITIVSGSSSKPRAASGFNVYWPDGDWRITDKGDPTFQDYVPIDDQMSDAERRRLLYVACTRAVDHLVVSLHRAPVGKTAKLLDNAQLLAECGALDAPHAEPWGGTATALVPFGQAGPELEWGDADEWAAERSRASRAATTTLTISATAVAAGAVAEQAVEYATTERDTGLDKEPVDLDLPPWQRGRYGTAVGRAVHAVLQFCDLATGADIDAHAAAQCAAEGILGQDALVAALARSAIAAPAVRDALAGPHHRELFVAAPVGGRVLEGYIDLFVDTPEGGLIVDYKTDQWPDDGERTSRVAKYRLQLAAYAVALAQITGRTPAAGVLVRCRPNGAAEQIEIPDWAGAMAAVAGTLGEGSSGPEDPA